MAQTTAGLSFVAAKVFISDDVGVGWINLSPYASSVAVGGGERSTGEVNTLDGVTPITKGGDRASIDVTVRFAYTEEADPGPWAVLEAVHAGDGDIEVQWSPSGVGDAGFWFHADGAILTNLTYPGGEALPGDPIVCEFVVKVATLAKSGASVAAG